MHNHENKCDILFASNYAALKLNFDNFVKMEANEILPYIKQTKPLVRKMYVDIGINS